MKSVLLKQLQQQSNRQLLLHAGLPEHFILPCQIECSWTHENHPHYQLLTLTIDATLTIHCVRCATIFSYPFHHKNQLAFCDNQTTLDQLFSIYDCMLTSELPTSLEALVIEELHLYAPEKHPEDCEFQS